MNTAYIRDKNGQRKIRRKTDDLIWVVDVRLSDFQCPMGQVMELYHGDDIIAKSAKIKLATGIFKRPLIKLLPLEIDCQRLLFFWPIFRSISKHKLFYLFIRYFYHDHINVSMSEA